MAATSRRRAPRGGRIAASAPTHDGRTATLTYMPQQHDPFSLPELVDLLDPQPGETAVDCTFGAGGHARAIGERLGADGKLICIDRDPAVEARFEEMAARLPARPASSAPSSPTALGALLARGHPRRHRSTWTSGCPRCSSTPGSAASPTPTTRRSTCAWTRSRRSRPREIVNEWPQARIAKTIQRVRRGAPRRLDRAGDRRAPAARDDLRARRRRSRPAMPPADRFGRGQPRQAHLPGDPDRRQRRARRSLARRCPLAWELLDEGGRFAAISFHSLEDRPGEAVPRRAVPRLHLPARACRSASAAASPRPSSVTRRAVAPGAEERERNPRSCSAHLRVASSCGDGVRRRR